MLVVDASNAVLGRLASHVAKKLLTGEQIVVINAEKAVVSGKPENSVDYFYGKLERGDAHKGPFFPKEPQALLRRVVRGMLPWGKPKGRVAYKRLRVFSDAPEEFKNPIKLGKSSEDLTCKYTTLKDICGQLGAKV